MNNHCYIFFCVDQNIEMTIIAGQN